MSPYLPYLPREMAKVCALCALRVLLGVFFGFGGLFFRLPRLRLLVSDVNFHRKRAVPWRDDPPGCLACMHRDLAPGCTARGVGLWALR
jgi:hypothetical protein